MGGAFSVTAPSTGWNPTSLGGGGEVLTLDSDVEVVAQRLFLSSKEVMKLYEKFCTINSSGSGTINPFEFCAHLQLEITEFVVRLFDLLDQNNSGELDFLEFLVQSGMFARLMRNLQCGLLFRSMITTMMGHPPPLY